MPKSQIKEFFVIAHNIRSLHNVGSIFRTADAFNITKVYLTGFTGTPDYYVHKNKIEKVALGAEKFVSWEYAKSPTKLIKTLKAKQVQIVALENHLPKGVKLAGPVALHKFKPQFPLALVLGQERKGISQAILNLCDTAVEIPMFGQKESLNVSVAFGIASFCLTRK
jgi:tRNA G18 (ribose-2'-O)-methylase SpoU